MARAVDTLATLSLTSVNEMRRTAEIIGSSGQVCATLPLDRSDGCDAAELSFADGSLALHARDSCTLRWWPRLGLRAGLTNLSRDK